MLYSIRYAQENYTIRDCVWKRGLIMNIVVLAGGTSTERDISILTSTKVCESLRRNGYNANIVDVFFGIDSENVDNFFNNDNDLEKLCKYLKNQTPDVEKELEARKALGKGFFGDNVLELCQKADIVFMGLHGSNGEDGKIQAAFELMGIKYTGTDYISSAISMSKELTKKVLVPEGIPMPKGIALHKGHKVEYVPFPCVVKPCCGGSSVGVSIVNSEEEFKRALTDAFSYEDNILVEEFIPTLNASSVPVSVSSSITERSMQGVFARIGYDYKNKYKAGATKETCPANLPKEISEKMQRWAEKACETAGVTTYARVDELLNEDGDIYCLEINTLPGMTGTSLLPQEAAAVGMSYDELTKKIIEISLEKYN